MEKETATVPDKNRFDIGDVKFTMKAVVTTGNGGYEKLEYRDVPIPKLGSNEVLLQVLSAGVNNTEINTRLGWYSSSVKTGTGALATGEKKSRKRKHWEMAVGMKRHPFHLFRERIVAGGWWRFHRESIIA